MCVCVYVCLCECLQEKESASKRSGEKGRENGRRSVCLYKTHAVNHLLSWFLVPLHVQTLTLADIWLNVSMGEQSSLEHRILHATPTFPISLTLLMMFQENNYISVSTYVIVKFRIFNDAEFFSIFIIVFLTGYIFLVQITVFLSDKLLQQWPVSVIQLVLDKELKVDELHWLVVSV